VRSSRRSIAPRNSCRIETAADRTGIALGSCPNVLTPSETQTRKSAAVIAGAVALVDGRSRVRGAGIATVERFPPLLALARPSKRLRATAAARQALHHVERHAGCPQERQAHSATGRPSARRSAPTELIRTIFVNIARQGRIQ